MRNRISHSVPAPLAVTLFRNVVTAGQSILENQQLIWQVLLLSAGYLAAGYIWNRKQERSLLESIFG